jgi:cytochrome c-type biogenesis protein CcmF
MLLSLAFSFGIFFWRYPMLKSDRPLDSFLSREAAFLVNNFLLLAVVAVTLWGVIFPLVNEFAQDTTVTVATPYFNRVNGPLLLALLALMGVGPVLPWRRANRQSLKRWLLWPTVIALLAFVSMLAVGLDEPIALMAFSVLVFVAASIGQEWLRGTLARRRAGEGWAGGFVRHIAGNRPRHGGYIVHLAILVLAFGVVGTQFYDQRSDAVVRPGESFRIDNYRIEFVSSESEERADRLAQWANLDAFDGDRYLGRLRPWQAFYPAFNQVSVRAGIRSTPIEDLYIAPTDFLEDGRAVFRVSVNPLAWWLWIAGPVFILGTAIALWPQPAVELRTAPAISRRPGAPLPQTVS